MTTRTRRGRVTQVPDLRKALDALGLDTVGLKAVLVDRLVGARGRALPALRLCAHLPSGASVTVVHRRPRRKHNKLGLRRRRSTVHPHAAR